MDRLEHPVLRPLVWLGDSKRNIQGFPKGAQKLLGDELQLIQFGGVPKEAKPFKEENQLKSRSAREMCLPILG